MRFITSALATFAAITFAATAAAQAPEGWSDLGAEHPYGTIYSADGSADGLRMLVKSRAEIEESCACDLDDETDGSVEETILFGLSTMWLDVFDHKANAKSVTGEAMTEHGDQTFAANIDRSGDAERIVVLIGPPDQFADFMATGKTPAPGKALAKAPTKPPAKPAPQQAAAATPRAGATAFADSNGYPAPNIYKAADDSREIQNWPKTDAGRIAKQGDARAPRQEVWTVTDIDLDNPKALLKEAITATDLKSVKIDAIEPIEIANEMVGSRVHIVVGSAKRAGKTVRFYANIRIGKGDDSAVVSIYDAPPAVYADWGGIAVPMSLAGIYDSSDWTVAAIEQAGSLNSAAQVALFEDHYTKKMMSLFQGIAMTNMGTLNNMRSFNMGTAACAGVENCTVTPDGTGGYTAKIEP